LSSEIKVLWESLSSVEQYYKDASDIRDNEIDILKSHSDQLK
jgi:hypothetical protein